jgi:hypothetical protein
MLSIVLFLWGIGKEQETRLGVLKGLIWRSDATSSQHKLQQAIFRCAVGCSPCISSLSSAPIRVFSIEHCTAGTLHVAGSVPDPTAGLETLYREQERRKRVLGWRRTHKDPFEGEWEQIISWLMAHPERSSGGIFRELQRRSPGRYQPLQIRTLQRGMRKIRAHPARKCSRSTGKRK